MKRKSAKKDSVLTLDTPSTIDDTEAELETVRLSFVGRGKPRVAYAPEAAPKRFALVDEEQVENSPPEVDDTLDLDGIAPAPEEGGLSWLYALGIVLAAGWVGFSVIFAGSPAMAAVQETMQAALPGLVLVMGFGVLWMVERQERNRLATWQSALKSVFNVDEKQLQGQAHSAKTLARSLSEVQLQMRGVNTQLWVMQKNIGDIERLKTDLEFLGQEVSTFSTVSRRAIMDWDSQLVESGARLENLERVTARVSHDSLETCSFLSDRLEEVTERLEELNLLQDKASETTARFGDQVNDARDDLKDLIKDSQSQSEAAAKAQEAFRAQLKAHISDLARELEALGNMAKAFDGVRADMGLAADVLSRGVRESLMDVKLLLQDWRDTKMQLESVLALATDRVTREFDAQLSAAKNFMADWDGALSSRVALMTSTQEQIQAQLDKVPQALQATAKLVLAETPELMDRFNQFRHAAASMQQSIQTASAAAGALNSISPDISRFKDDVSWLSDKAAKARSDLEAGLGVIAPDIAKLDAVTARAQSFFAALESKTAKHVAQLESMENVLERLQKPMVADGVLEQLQPVLTTLEKFDERCDDLEKRAMDARQAFESVDLKPLMKTMVLDVEAVFDRSIDVLAALKPQDSALKNRDDLPALTIRLRQVVEGVKPDVLAASLRTRPALRDAVRQFTARFGTICEEARTSSPQGEWVAAALASSELGKIHRALLRALDLTK